MLFRRTELERVNAELFAAAKALEAAEQAHRELNAILFQLRELEERLQELARTEMDVVHELQRLSSSGWYALYNSVLGTAEDKHVVELAALHRTHTTRQQLETKRLELQQRVEAVLSQTRTHDEARARWEAAVAEKERLLQSLDTLASQRMQRVLREEEEVQASLERIDQAIRSRQARGASTRELRMLRSVWRETLARKAALQEERRAILLDGLSVSWRAAS